METDQIPSSPRRQRGVAMFAVLGAIVLVTLLGAVGLTLAERDQRLGGDLSALKSADEMGLAGLRLAVNRLEADPVNMVVQLNTFIASKAGKSWFDLSGPKVLVQPLEPKWLPLTTDPDDNSAVKVKILAISQGDTTGVPSYDISNVYIALECQARSRQGDLRTATATYHIQGVSLSITNTVRQFRIPDYALYLGGGVQTSNLRADITGDVYINGSNDGTFFNGGAAHTIHGGLKWNGNFASNAPMTVDSNIFINGNITLNAGAPQTFKGNLGVAGGLRQMNSSLTVKGNLWLGSTQPPVVGSWNSGGQLQVDGNLVWVASSAMTAGDFIQVGKNAWFLSGISTNGNAPITIGRSLYVRDSSGFGFATAMAAPLHVGKNLVVNIGPSHGSQPFQITGTANTVGDSLISLSAIDNGTITVDSVAAATSTATGHISARTQIGKSATILNAAYLPPPKPTDLGLDTNIMKTSVADNPMDSVKLDVKNSPEAFSHIVEVNSQLLADASLQSRVLNPTNLNRLFTYLDSTHRTFNGYMVLHLGSDAATAFTSSSDDPGVGFRGKAIFQVTARLPNLSYWPHSNDSTNIQIIDIESGGDLGAWGWLYGDFAGIFYWSDPSPAYCTTNKSLNLPGSGTFYGSIIIGNSSGCTGPRITPQHSVTVTGMFIKRSVSIYVDIGMNLPGVLRPAMVNGAYRNMSSITISQWNSLLRLTTSKPFFQTMGIYR